MPPFGPIKRSDLIFYLRRAGFAGPYAGGKHEYVAKGTVKVSLPNPHHGDVGKELLTRILRQAGIPREDWERL
jgi:hypothetical protein